MFYLTKILNCANIKLLKIFTVLKWTGEEVAPPHTETGICAGRQIKHPVALSSETQTNCLIETATQVYKLLVIQVVEVVGRKPLFLF